MTVQATGDREMAKKGLSYETPKKQRTDVVSLCADRDSNPGLGVGNA